MHHFTDKFNLVFLLSGSRKCLSPIVSISYIMVIKNCKTI